MVERRNTSMPSKPLEPHELDKIATATLAHYEQRAEDFRAGTRDHDVSQNIAALLRHIEGESPFTILDFGCGPGRDLETFAGLGHTAIGLEGAPDLPPWRVPTPGARCGSRIFSSWTCRASALMASSPTPRCFMCRPRNCRACCGNCTPH